MTSWSAEVTIKSAATTKVSLKITCSSPLLVNEVADPHDLVSPPLDLGWMRIRTVNVTANTISTVSNMVFVSIIDSIYYFAHELYESLRIIRIKFAFIRIYLQYS